MTPRQTMSDHKRESLHKRILWIIPRVPWPPQCGASMANCMLIQCMTEKGWKVDLLCLERLRPQTNIEEIRGKMKVESVEIIAHSLLFRLRILRVFYALFHQLLRRKIPLTAVPFTVGRMGRTLRQKLNSSAHQLILWDGLHPMAILESHCSASNSRTHESKIHIYRAHNCETAIWTQFLSNSHRFFHPFIAYQTKLMADLERSILARASVTLAISEADRRVLQKMTAEQKRIVTIPAIITKLQVQHGTRGIHSNLMEKIGNQRDLRLLWMGGMDWWPNLEGLTWFLQHVWPALQNQDQRFSLNIIGKNTERFKRLNNGNLCAHGFVHDPQQFLLNSDILIVPIFSGSGVRIKALEALSAGLPCLGTVLGLEGIPQEGCWMAETVDEWCDTLFQITPAECSVRGKKGQSALSQNSAFSAAGEQLEILFEELIQGSNH